jgi:hypothetical protein
MIFVSGTTFEIRVVGTDAVAYSGALTAWNNGEIDGDSGDRLWWAGLHYTLHQAANSFINTNLFI